MIGFRHAMAQVQAEWDCAEAANPDEPMADARPSWRTVMLGAAITLVGLIEIAAVTVMVAAR